jgi:hypothetical protein
MSWKRNLTFGKRRGERGADLVEAALVLPILLTVVLGLISFARAWNVYQTMTRAAREGVHQAIITECATCNGGMYYDPSTDIQNNIVFPALKAEGIDTSRIQNYSQGYTWLDPNDTVCGAYIKFQYPFQVAVPFVPVPITNITLSTDVQMRLENPPPVSSGTCP